MGDDGGAGIVLMFGGGLMVVASVLGVISGRQMESGDWRKAAVQAGHAEYVVGEDGESVWQWKAVVK